MAQVTIAGLPQASTPLTGLELTVIVQNGVTVQTPVNSLVAIAAGVTSITGTSNQIIASNPSGAVTLSLPQNINSGAAPNFLGTNFTGIPNSAFTNSSLTIGSTNIPLGSTALTIAGLTSVTSGSFIATGSITGMVAVAPISIGTLNYSDTNTFESLQTNVNSYAQLILQNTNSGAIASTDIVVSNNSGTASTFYGNFGINSSGFTGTGAFNAVNATYLTSTSGDLAIGTTTSNAIHFVVNSGNIDALTISSSGGISTPNQITSTLAIGTAPFIITSTTNVANLNASSLNGATFAAPGSIGSGTAGSGAFTTISASGITTLSNGSSTNPSLNFANESLTGLYSTGAGIGFSVGGTTVGNVVASGLNNIAIGSTTASTGKFTTLSTTGLYSPSSTVGILGTTTNDNAQAGSWGEFPTPTNLFSVSLTSSITSNVSSISLTAGDYEVSGVIQFLNAATTTVSSIAGGISSVSGTLPAAGSYLSLNATFAAGAQQQFSVPVQRITLSTTTTIYLVCSESFAVSTATASGFMHVRRVR